LLRAIRFSEPCVEPTIAPSMPEGPRPIRAGLRTAMEPIEVSLEHLAIIQLFEIYDGLCGSEFSQTRL
jgi:hypothetical protein